MGNSGRLVGNGDSGKFPLRNSGWLVGCLVVLGIEAVSTLEDSRFWLVKCF